jgi:hypothetical protein
MAKRSVWIAVGIHKKSFGRECNPNGREIIKWNRKGEARCPVCGDPLPKKNMSKIVLISEEDLKLLEECQALEEKRVRIRDAYKWPRCSCGNILGSCQNC